MMPPYLDHVRLPRVNRLRSSANPNIAQRIYYQDINRFMSCASRLDSEVEKKLLAREGG
jgi:hypothetical protein